MYSACICPATLKSDVGGLDIAAVDVRYDRPWYSAFMTTATVSSGNGPIASNMFKKEPPYMYSITSHSVEPSINEE